jgi:hypothetical protein
METGGEPRRVFDNRARDFGWGASRLTIGGWSPDSQSFLITAEKGWNKQADRFDYDTWRLDSDGGNRTLVPLAVTDLTQDFSPDGRQILVESLCDFDKPKSREPRDWVPPVANVAGSDTSRRTQLLESERIPGGRIFEARYRYSTDGETVFYDRQDPRSPSKSLWSVGIGMDGLDRKCLIRANKVEYPDSFCVSPDGKQLAVVFRSREAGEEPKRSELSILDKDGRNRRVIPLPFVQFGVLDWRPLTS